jgi:hypothetical protein
MRVKSGVGCLGSRGHGLGHPIQVADGDVLPGIVGSVDALARERLDDDVAGTGFLVSPLSDVQNINVGCRVNTGARIQGRGRRVESGGGEAAGGQGKTVRGNGQSRGPSSSH